MENKKEDKKENQEEYKVENIETKNFANKVKVFMPGEATAPEASTLEQNQLLADLEQQAQMWQADKATLESKIKSPSRAQILASLAKWQTLEGGSSKMVQNRWRSLVVGGLTVAAALAVTVILVALLATNNTNNSGQVAASAVVLPTLEPSLVAPTASVSAPTPPEGATMTAVPEKTPTPIPTNTPAPTETPKAEATQTPTPLPPNPTPANNRVVQPTVAPVEVTLPPTVDAPATIEPKPVPTKPTQVTVVGKIISISGNSFSLATVNTTYTIKFSGNTKITRNNVADAPKVGDTATINGLLIGQGQIEATAILLGVQQGAPRPIGDPTFPDDKN
jgi:hypothetical protein